ncbi:helix-turn-helix domain-containing protein [Variovorax sp. KK3]|uniref:helix-turn-helix domain-containing protein n=1 Tax=Variovorax sp. KK3 TaxID=1855728 RepID=UPI00097C4E0F|nr:helix-turn-helix domain-containing protein [Variovorax sp. KK3]
MNQSKRDAFRGAGPAPGVKSITALRRGLDVFWSIQQSSAATLADLHRQTSLSKATLLRILKTLQEAGWIARNEVENRYVPAASPGESGLAVAWRTRLSALATQPREQLQKVVPWPIDLAVRDGLAMLILDTNRPINGLAVNYRVLGFRPRLLLSSLGRCYLAFCPDDERRRLLDALARSPYEVDRAALKSHGARDWASRYRAQGYASRDPSPTSMDSPERFGAISVPIVLDGAVVACMSCAWLPAVATEQQIVERHLADLKVAARAVQDRLSAARFPAAAPDVQ